MKVRAINDQKRTRSEFALFSFVAFCAYVIARFHSVQNPELPSKHWECKSKGQLKYRKVKEIHEENGIWRCHSGLKSQHFFTQHLQFPQEISSCDGTMLLFLLRLIRGYENYSDYLDC
jgi:hypothetical protein